MRESPGNGVYSADNGAGPAKGEYMGIRLDHLVLTVADIDATTRFYNQVLGLQAEQLEQNDRNRQALRIGGQLIKLHAVGHGPDPAALRPMPGSADLCLVTDEPVEELARHVRGCGVTIERGPVDRWGAAGALVSIYFRDPDGNLIELSNLADSAA